LGFSNQALPAPDSFHSKSSNTITSMRRIGSTVRGRSIGCSTSIKIQDPVKELNKMYQSKRCSGKKTEISRNILANYIKCLLPFIAILCQSERRLIQQDNMPSNSICILHTPESHYLNTKRFETRQNQKCNFPSRYMMEKTTQTIS
jgi:hypothetical protein